MRITVSVFWLCASISAQGPIFVSDGNVRFDYSVYPASTTAVTDRCAFTANGLNHCYASWWYYALASDATGSAFNTSGNQMTAAVSADGRSAELVWLNTDNRNFSAILTNTVYSTGTSSGISAQTMTIINNTGNSLPINIYAYLDLDVNGTLGGDIGAQEATLPTGNHTVQDVVTVWHTANAFNNWAVGTFPSLRGSILAGAGGAPWVPGNAGLPFGPNDYTSVFHWVVTIPPGGSQSFETMIADSAIPASQRVARTVNYCSGKAGTNGVPTWASTRGFIGSSARLRIDNGFTGSAPIVFLGTAQASIPFPPLGTICAIPVTTIAMPAFDGARVSSLAVPIPALRALGNVQLHFQGLFADPGALASLAHTDGMSWTLGNYAGN